jgi:hypothetical protein
MAIANIFNDDLSLRDCCGSGNGGLQLMVEWVGEVLEGLLLASTAAKEAVRKDLLGAQRKLFEARDRCWGLARRYIDLGTFCYICSLHQMPPWRSNQTLLFSNRISSDMQTGGHI